MLETRKNQSRAVMKFRFMLPSGLSSTISYFSSESTEVLFTLGDNVISGEGNTLLSLLRNNRTSLETFGQEVHLWQDFQIIAHQDCDHYFEDIGFEKYFLNASLDNSITRNVLY